MQRPRCVPTRWHLGGPFPVRVAANTAITTRGLTRRFHHVTAVDQLELTVMTGTFFGLLGSNGAGKTTTIKMLTTLLPPSEGTAQVCGFDIVREAREVRRHIGYVPQMLSADASLTGRENLDLSAKLYGVPRSEREGRIDQALEFMDLTGAADTLVKTYSGGMIRRLEVAQALLHQPRVLFLDEPTIGLDPVARHAVWARLRELRARFGTSLLMTTHDMEEADALCERVAIMHRGRIVAEGTPAELKARVGADATMDDVFARYASTGIEEGGMYREVARTRRTAHRLG